ncbi:MAG: 2-amino-4-oxopentanoate thiolase subunit OrtA [Defluviitaleaceae bacterium]|nr:2-amino-4-oxopentanoate thiolase subunit OrtA [Defluviitaleaceae bacterium]
MVKRGTYVQIKATILDIGERAVGIPEDTAATPLLMWCKGKLTRDSEIGHMAEIVTASGRIESGILEEVEPITKLDYGQYIPEMAQIGGFDDEK